MVATARKGSVLLIAALAWPAEAGVIRGMVKTPPPAAEARANTQAYPGRASALPQVPARSLGAVSDAVVSVERIPAEAESALAREGGATPRLAQKDQVFVPHVLPIAVGTTVEFPNLDPIFHNVFSVSPAKRFDLGKYARGQSRRVTFPKAGLVEVYCDIHSNMAAFILVLPHHAFTQPDGLGAFELPELPGGEYVLKAWHPELSEIRRNVRVPAEGDVRVELAF